jgi:transcriptional regulator with XRE-family HTH domain
MSVEYDYSKLTGRIVEKFGTRKEFAKAVGLTPETISMRLSGKRDFSRDEIFHIAKLLEIPYNELEPYFFCVKG